MMNKKTCSEFQKTGLLLFINQFLHIFGWAIVVETLENGEEIMYPAQVKFRGFNDESVSKAYIKLSHYINENSSRLLEEAEE